MATATQEVEREKKWFVIADINLVRRFQLPNTLCSASLNNNNTCAQEENFRLKKSVADDVAEKMNKCVK